MTEPRTAGSAGVASPAPARRRRPAQGARYLVTGISASAVLGGITAFGIADLRAAQAEPTSPSVPPDAGAVATAAPGTALAPPSTPAPIIKIVIRRAGDQSSASASASASTAAAAQRAPLGATVPPAPAASVSPSPTPTAAAPARAAPAPAAPAPPAQSRSKAS